VIEVLAWTARIRFFAAAILEVPVTGQTGSTPAAATVSNNRRNRV
jgi:hypothetical protein